MSSRRIQSVLFLTLLFAGNLAEAAGFPQLDTRWYSNQLFWLVVSFALLYIIVSVMVVPSIRGVLATRSDAIEEAIRQAELAKRTAESTKITAESEGMTARNEAAAYMAKAQAQATQEATEAFAKIDHELDRKMAQTEARIEEAKAKALSGMNDATASLARVMASKLLGHDIEQRDAHNVVTQLKATGS